MCAKHSKHSLYYLGRLTGSFLRSKLQTKKKSIPELVSDNVIKNPDYVAPHPQISSNTLFSEIMYEIDIFELRNEEINVKKTLAVINTTYAVAKRKPEKKNRLTGIRTLTSAIPVQRFNQLSYQASWSLNWFVIYPGKMKMKL